MTHKHWTPSEIAYIKEKYATVETKSLAKRLNVTEYQIRAVVLKYGLKKRCVRTSTNDNTHPYMRGITFWENNTFWRRDLYTKESRERLDAWLEEMRESERSLTRL